jgi:hypothetical protein
MSGKLLKVGELIDLEILDERFPVRRIPAQFDPDQQVTKPKMDGRFYAYPGFKWLMKYRRGGLVRAIFPPR